jgi:protein-S-isoprenylcysteine O-methyltransferase Ste14
VIHFFYSHPTWEVGALVIGVWTGLSLLGLVIFNHFVDPHAREKDTETVGLTYAIVAVVFAVLIAVIVVDVWETFAKADEIAAAEANKLSNLLLDTAGLPAPAADDVRADINKYIDIVIKTEWPNQQDGKLDEAVFEPGWSALAHLSTQLAVFEPTTMGQNATKAEMLRAVNELIKARRNRILAAGDHLPDIVWGILLISGAIAVFYTYLFGAHSFGIHLTITGLIASSIALVFVLLIALDYPFRGDVSVSDEAFVSVQTTMGGAGHAPEGEKPKPD